MISLISELTDAKGRSAAQGWVLFDAGCSFCVAWARRLHGTLESRGFGLAPLQSPRVRALLDLPEHDLLREMRLLTPDGSVLGGADALIYVAGHIWWAWPVYALAQLPGMGALLRSGYRWLAARRHCLSGVCDGKTNHMLPGGRARRDGVRP